ncbi:MAG TPA: response regulator, partial [Terriglobales bacterium]|nr:response regulator [Terriglobales bacterium]
IVLTVTDNGCGMNADTKAHIFEPFFTTKEQGKGTGLGLATVFGIVKQSGGHITVESEPGRGSIFRVYLPKTEDAVEEARRLQAISARGNETILLVEDEHAVRESTAEFLAQNGYRVLIAENGPEALRMAEQYEQPIHLLLSDLVMPRMSGKELSERIVGLHAETRVVFMSGYSQNLLSHQQILDPAYSLLHKPFRLADLGQLIRETLDRTRAAKAGG